MSDGPGPFLVILEDKGLGSDGGGRTVMVVLTLHTSYYVPSTIRCFIAVSYQGPVR